ncbi:hypothetical protein HYU91_01190 [Candidatus Collierbacteria bacterium]|nr:hypothetical protein [Candidatus Collierbacteria bacterium]
MNKTAELGSWISEYFEGHPADYFEDKVLVQLQKDYHYIESTEGGFEVWNGSFPGVGGLDHFVLKFQKGNTMRIDSP